MLLAGFMRRTAGGVLNDAVVFLTSNQVFDVETRVRIDMHEEKRV